MRKNLIIAHWKGAFALARWSGARLCAGIRADGCGDRYAGRLERHGGFFNTSHPLQRAWRDIHFMSMHIAVNTEMNFSHYGRMELGLGRDASRPYF